MRQNEDTPHDTAIALQYFCRLPSLPRPRLEERNERAWVTEEISALQLFSSHPPMKKKIHDAPRRQVETQQRKNLENNPRLWFPCSYLSQKRRSCYATFRRPATRTNCRDAL